MSTHTWCKNCIPDVAPHEVHEAPSVVVDGVSSKVPGDNQIFMQVNYIDGHRDPLLFVGGEETDMTLDQAETLHRELGEQIRLLRTVQPTLLAVTR